jgi:endonuclease YncB( thermonuclease family)
MTDYLDNINYNDTIPFIPPLTCGKVIKVYDGDTLTIASKLPYEGCPIYRFSVRINGIDCPEMKTKNQNEKTCAKMAKAKVYDAVFGKIVTLQNVKLEKYGRVLADVYIGDVSIGDMLCQYNLAVKYDGGTKHVPIDWLEYYNEQNTQSTTPIQTEQAQQTL